MTEELLYTMELSTWGLLLTCNGNENRGSHSYSPPILCLLTLRGNQIRVVRWSVRDQRAQKIDLYRWRIRGPFCALFLSLMIWSVCLYQLCLWIILDMRAFCFDPSYIYVHASVRCTSNYCSKGHHNVNNWLRPLESSSLIWFIN